MIQVKNLTKKYGDFLAIDDLSFEIEEGHIYGFLGSNGAGKSTTMNIMTGCLSATCGEVWVNEYNIFDQPMEAKKLIGYLPEQPPLYMNESPEEYLEFVGEAKGLRGKILKEQIEKVIEQTHIQAVRSRRISKLSKGYRQRVGIAQALLGSPKIIILDEPTVGLDPIQIIEIRDLIRELGKEHTVILSSHILTEVQALCEKILIIANGKLVAFDTPENLECQMLSSNQIVFTVDAEEDEIKEVLEEIGEIRELKLMQKKKDMMEVHFTFETKEIEELLRKLFFVFAKKGKAILEMNVKKANLEDIFIELTENALEEEKIIESEESEEC